jgi:glycosyltransferase involved in cell wall biosynthesis
MSSVSVCYGAAVKILWGSPLPPTRSGVSDYAIELLSELGARATVRVLEPPRHATAEFREFVNGVRVVPTDTMPDADEVSLIHIGNNPHHAWLLDRLRFPNTVAVVHDLVLHHLLVEASAGDDVLLETSLREAHGVAGATLARARRYGLTGRRDPFLFPARAAFLGSVKGVIVHSRWAESSISQEFPDLPRLRVGLAVADPGKVLPVAERGRLGLSADEVVLMHLGFLTQEKGLEQILTGVAAASRVGVPVRLLLVGEGKGMDALRAAATSAGVARVITETGWVSPESFPAIPAAADLGVVLRTPTAGETSAAVVRFLAAGTPVAVGGTRQFLEWPVEAAPRLTPGPAAPAELARLLASAWKGGERWQERRRAARAAYEANHRPADAAEAMVNFLATLAP